MSKARELAELGDTLTVDGSGNIDITGTVTADNIISTGTLSSSKAAGYGAVEVGGPSGGLIDLKAPFSDDYDARIIYNAGADLQIVTLADEPILLRQGGSTKLQTTTTGVNVQGKFDATSSIAVGTAVTNGAKLTIESGQDDPSLTGTMATGHFVAQTSSGGPALNVGSDASGTWYNSAYSNNAGIARIHRWLVGGEEAMRVNTSGNLGIGTSSPDTALHVDSGTVNNVAKFHSTDSSASIYLTDGTTTGGDTGVQGLIATGDILEVRGLNKVILATGTTDRMTIDSSGNVGIGTAAPASPFHLTTGVDGNALQINGASNAWEFMVKSGPSGVNDFPYSIGLYRDDGATPNGVINFGRGSTTNNGHMTFDVNSVEAMRIDASGDVLVGKTTAVGSSTAGHELRSDGLTYHTSAGTCLVLNRSTTVGGNIAAFKINDSTVGSISVTGSATSYNTSSDYRLKENITPVQGASDIVKAMQPVTYTFKSDGSWHDGFLAHELQEFHPRAVTGSKDAMVDEEYEVTPAVYEDVIIPAVDAVVEVPAVYDDEGVLVSEMVPAIDAQPERTEQHLVTEAVMGTRSVPDYQGVDYSKLTPILTAALQEALNKIDALEARLTVLEGTV